MHGSSIVDDSVSDVGICDSSSSKARESKDTRRCLILVRSVTMIRRDWERDRTKMYGISFLLPSYDRSLTQIGARRMIVGAAEPGNAHTIPRTKATKEILTRMKVRKHRRAREREREREIALNLYFIERYRTCYPYDRHVATIYVILRNVNVQR